MARLVFNPTVPIAEPGSPPCISYSLSLSLPLSLSLSLSHTHTHTSELLDSIARFEHRELTSISSSAQPPSLPHKHSQLEPLNTAGGDKLLHMEINRLKDENRKLEERVHTLESKVLTEWATTL